MTAKQSSRAAIACLLMLILPLVGCTGSGTPTGQTSESANDSIPEVIAEPDDNDLLRVLQGVWQSEDDNNYSLEITDTQLRHLQNGKAVMESTIDVDGTCRNTVCPDSLDTSDGWCFIEKTPQGRDEQAQCFFVQRCDAGLLQYRLLNGTGKTLSFKKIK
jgi:hypothetical protein